MALEVNEEEVEERKRKRSSEISGHRARELEREGRLAKGSERGESLGRKRVRLRGERESGPLIVMGDWCSCFYYCWGKHVVKHANEIKHINSPTLLMVKKYYSSR